MNTFLLVSLVAVLPTTFSSQFPCSDCGNVTGHLNLVVKDSKVTQDLDSPKPREPIKKKVLVSEESMTRSKTLLGNVTSDAQQLYHGPGSPLNKVAVHTSNTSLNYFNLPSAKFVTAPINSLRWQIYMYGDINDLFDKSHTLSLYGLGTTGDELKARLSQLNDTVTPLIKSLILETNNIQFLPVLTFPVWMEYYLLELRLDKNPLSFLTTNTRFEISRLGRLKTLGLSQTDLRSLESLNLPSLEVLDLSKNRLTYIPPSLSSLRNLRQLYLADNQIVYVMSSSPLSDLHNLQLLSLTNNHISRIWNKSLYRVDKLYLNNNYLESLSEVKDTGAKAVYLNGNPWQCSCPLLDALHSDYPQVIIDNMELQCTLEDQEVLAITLDERDVQLGCPRWWDRIRIKVERYVPPQRVSWFIIYIILGWLTILVAVNVIIRSRRRSINKPVTQKSPYTILDDKNVI